MAERQTIEQRRADLQKQIDALDAEKARIETEWAATTEADNLQPLADRLTEIDHSLNQLRIRRDSIVRI